MTHGAVARERVTVAALVLAAATVSLSTTLGVPLLAEVSRRHDVSLDAAQWVLTITLLVAAVATPVIGRLGDGSLRRPLLLATLSCVVIGATLGATAESFVGLLAGRALQGVGYGTLPLAMALVREHTTGSRTSSGVAALSLTVAVGAGLGFPVTGVLAEHLGFDAAFWFGAAFGAIALAVAAVAIPRSGTDHPPLGVDAAGAVLLGGGLAALLLAVTHAASWGWTSARVLVLFGSAALVLTAWVAVELRHPHPLIDLRLVSKREIAGVNGAAFAMAMGMFMALTLVSRLAQTPTSTGYGLGASLSMAGLLLLPISVGSIASQPIARRLSARHGPLRVLAMGATLVSATLVVLAGAHGNVAVLLVATTLFGVGLGSTMAVMPAVIVANVPPHRTGSAISLNQVLRNVGGAFGSALTATVLAMHQSAGAAFPRDDGYVVALLVAAGACMAAAVLVVALAPRSVGAGALDARNAPSASGRRP